MKTRGFLVWISRFSREFLLFKDCCFGLYEERHFIDDCSRGGSLHAPAGREHLERKSATTLIATMSTKTSTSVNTKLRR